MDGAAERGLAQSHGVTGFPTLMIFENGTSAVYGGKREANEIYGELLDRKRPVANECDDMLLAFTLPFPAVLRAPPPPL